MRFLVSSSNLLNNLRSHRTSERVSLTMDVARRSCTLLSAQGPTELPMDFAGVKHDVTATVDTQRLFAALLSMEDQPIVLDLHPWPAGGNTLHAIKVHRYEHKEDEHEPIEFAL